MNSDKTYSERAIEVAEFFFANPMAKRGDVLAKFGEKWRTSSRTFDRICQEAREYNKTRSQRLEKAKDDVLVAEAKETIKKGIDYREESFTAVFRILKGSARKIEGEDEIILPSDSDILRAASWFADIHGWKAASKTDINFKRPVLNIEVADEEAEKTLENIKNSLQIKSI